MNFPVGWTETASLSRIHHCAPMGGNLRQSGPPDKYATSPLAATPTSCNLSVVDSSDWKRRKVVPRVSDVFLSEFSYLCFEQYPGFGLPSVLPPARAWGRLQAFPEP